MLYVDKIVNSIFDSITWLLSETESNQVWLVRPNYRQDRK